MEQAIEAGEKKATIMQRILSVISLPLYFYFIGIPFFKYFWMPLLPKWMTGLEPAPIVMGPDLEPSNYWLSWG
jgi:hypothetical protein